MSITESEYSSFRASIEGLKAQRPAPGSPQAQRLELLTIKCSWYEWEQNHPPAGSTPPDSDRLFDLLDRMLTPAPEVAQGERPTSPIPTAHAGDRESGRVGR